MTKKKEVDSLVARYRADIAALEERKEDLMKHIEILENLIPAVLVWYMWKIFQSIEFPYSQGTPFPQNEIEKAKDHLTHLQGVLKELQEAVKLINEEESIMRRRVEELETFSEQADKYPDTMIGKTAPTPEKSESGKREKENLEVEVYKDDKVKLGDDTDWKKVCKDLLKQVDELTENIKNSSQKIKENEDHAKCLEKEYLKLENELQEKILLLETQSQTLSSKTVGKEREKYLQEKVESKDALSAMQKALSEVRSMKESMSEGKEIEPLDQVSQQAESKKVSDHHDTAEISNKEETASKSLVSQKDKLPSKDFPKKTEGPLSVSKTSVGPYSTQMSNKTKITSKSEAAPEEKLHLKEAVSEKTVVPLPSIGPTSIQISNKIKTISEDAVTPDQQLLSKQVVSEKSEDSLPILQTSVAPHYVQSSSKSKNSSEAKVQPPLLEKPVLNSINISEEGSPAKVNASVSKDTGVGTTMVKTKEIELLTARYNADIAALEERKEHLLRQIKITENLIPTVFLWYMSKAYQSIEVPFNKNIQLPSHEIEEETREKLERHKKDLRELHQAVELVETEEKIIRKRIEELEKFDGQPVAEVVSNVPVVGERGKIEDPKTEGLSNQKENLEDQLQLEDTDWKKLCEDLMNKVKDLSQKLKNSSQQLKENEDYAKHLEEEYSKLEMELQAKIHFLEKKTSPKASIVTDKEKEKSLHEELETKEVLSAMEEALAEVKSMRESLSKSRTPSEDETRKVTDTKDSTVILKEDIDSQKKLKSDDLPLLSKEKSIVSKLTVPDEMSKQVETEVPKSIKSGVSETEKPTSAVIPAPGDIEAPETTIPKEDVSKTAEDELPEVEKEAVSEVKQIADESEAIKESTPTPAKEAVTKEESLKPDKEGEVTKTVKSVVSETEKPPSAVIPVPGDIEAPETTVPKEDVSKTAEDELPEVEKEAVSELKPITESTEAELLEAEAEDISELKPTTDESEALKESKTIPTEVPTKVSKEVKEGEVIKSVKSGVSEAEKPPTEIIVTTGDISEAPEKTVPKDGVSESADVELPKAEIEAVSITKQTTDESEVSKESKTTPLVAIVSKEASLKSAKEGEMTESKKSGVSETKKIPSEGVDSRGDITEQAEITAPKEDDFGTVELPKTDTEAVHEIKKESEASKESKIAPTEAEVSKELRSVTEDESTKPEVSETVATSGDKAPGTISKPSEPMLLESIPREEVSEGPLDGSPQKKIDEIQMPTQKQESPVPLVKPTTDLSIAGKPESSKPTGDGIEGQTTVSKPEKTPITDTSSLPSPSGEKEPGVPSKVPSGPSLAAQALQSKLLLKDHLIKSMADQLRELAHKNQWPGRKTFEAVASTDPVKTYDFDKNSLLLYLKGEEPQDYAEIMKSNKGYSSSNPLNVKIIRKIGENSLMIEWGPPPASEVVGFQIFVNGQFMYWVHSARRNIALLQPLDLKKLLEIAISPINENGEMISRSSTTYKPE